MSVTDRCQIQMEEASADVSRGLEKVPRNNWWREGALIDEFVGRVSVCKEGSGRPSCLSNVSPPRRADRITGSVS